MYQGSPSFTSKVTSINDAFHLKRSWFCLLHKVTIASNIIQTCTVVIFFIFDDDNNNYNYNGKNCCKIPNTAFKTV